MLWLPETNVLGRQSDNVPFGIDDTGPSTASPDINANVVVEVDC